MVVESNPKHRNKEKRSKLKTRTGRGHTGNHNRYHNKGQPKLFLQTDTLRLIRITRNNWVQEVRLMRYNKTKEVKLRIKHRGLPK